MKIALIDTGHANLRSVHRALVEASHSQKNAVSMALTHDPSAIRAADKIVVPGQGGFGDCLTGLHLGGAHEALVEAARRGTHYLGICLGLQALFERSDESPDAVGLGLYAGRCERLRLADGVKIPHMGWNQINLTHGGHPVLSQAGGDGAWFYFVHSFHAVPEDETLVCATATHGPNTVTAAVARDNVLATQFHPEKSQRAGIRLLEAFLAW